MERLFKIVLIRVWVWGGVFVCLFLFWGVAYEKLLFSTVKQLSSNSHIMKINVLNPPHVIFLPDLLLPNLSSNNRILHQKCSLIIVSSLLSSLAQKSLFVQPYREHAFPSHLSCFSFFQCFEIPLYISFETLHLRNQNDLD